MLSLVHHQGSLYTDEDRRAAVAHWLLAGSVAAVSRATGIPERTIRHWMQTAWWDALMAEVGREKGAEIDAQLSRIITSALDAVEDRLENGEALPDGRRVPLRTADLVGILRLALDRRMRLQALGTSTPAPRMPLYDLAEALRVLGATHSEPAAPSTSSF